jgi:hypothetical protein
VLARDDAPADAAGAEDDASLRRMADRVESLISGFDAV